LQGNIGIPVKLYTQNVVVSYVFIQVIHGSYTREIAGSKVKPINLYKLYKLNKLYIKILGTGSKKVLERLRNQAPSSHKILKKLWLYSCFYFFFTPVIAFYTFESFRGNIGGKLELWKNQACLVEGRAFFCVWIPKLSILEGFFFWGYKTILLWERKLIVGHYRAF